MQSRSQLAWAAMLSAAFAFSACSSDTNPGGGGGNGGTPKPSDSGVHADATTNTPSDAGVVDAGPQGPCPEAFPGCRCTATDPTGMTDPLQDNCVNPNTVCNPLTMDLAVCLQECTMDTDCAGLVVGNPSMNRAANLCRDGLCVEAEAQDDERCRLHALAGRELTSCRTGAQCIRFADDPPGEGTCAQQCTPTPQDPTGGCTAPNGICNPRVLQGAGGASIGICTDSLRQVGSRCGSGLTDQCDTSVGNVFCFRVL